MNIIVKEVVSVLKHVVMWKFQENAEGKTKAEIVELVKNGLMKLPPIIPEIKAMEVVADGSKNGDNFDAMLVTEFESFEDLDVYKNHPEHQKISRFVAKVKVARASVDYCI